MWTSLSSIVDNLSEIYCKNVEIKIGDLCEILSGLKITDCTANVKKCKKVKTNKQINLKVSKYIQILQWRH